jgi:hypothetical protein
MTLGKSFGSHFCDENLKAESLKSGVDPRQSRVRSSRGCAGPAGCLVAKSVSQDPEKVRPEYLSATQRSRSLLKALNEYKAKARNCDRRWLHRSIGIQDQAIPNPEFLAHSPASPRVSDPRHQSKPNKAPEPTLGSVTPRATEWASK